MSFLPALRALANDRRLQILEWLADPRAHFRPQVDGDLVDDGVCGQLIAENLGVSAPTASEHLKVLTQAGLLRAKRIKQWTFYKRDEAALADPALYVSDPAKFAALTKAIEAARAEKDAAEERWLELAEQVEALG